LKTCRAFPQPFSDSRQPQQSTFGGKGSEVHTQISEYRFFRLYHPRLQRQTMPPL
jgi:hypothetical protein